ncbi:hypothetical protein CHL_1005 [Campylobacter hyointestinalis subsp. lawsonii CCUG 27631]|nr:hypothetical protein CHL_1005 [Campylobacter hyointestinalis subsp. lawsonii CCUG 27631]
MTYMLLCSNKISMEEEYLKTNLLTIDGSAGDVKKEVEKIRAINKIYGTDISYCADWATDKPYNEYGWTKPDRYIASHSNWDKTDNRLSFYREDTPLQSIPKFYFSFKICNYGSRKVFIETLSDKQRIFLEQNKVFHRLHTYDYIPNFNFIIHIL